jgi:hypothetical protein
MERGGGTEQNIRLQVQGGVLSRKQKMAGRS